jgi:VCBS repeat-containing protein
VFTSYTLGTGPSYGTLSFNPTNGAFTYTRAATDHSTPAADSFTVIATDANGRTVTLRVPVTPTVADAAPTVTGTTTDAGSTDATKWNLNTSTWTQTTTGKVTATDSDKDTLTYTLVNPTTHAPVTTTTNGGTVTLNSDGTYTYTIAKNQAYFHGAAKVGATGTAVNDSFTVAVNDGYGGVTYTTVTMPIYAVNTAPVISKSKTALTYTIKITDAEETIPTTKNPAVGQAGYSLSDGGTLTGSLSLGVLYTTTNTITVTAWDGYYVVINGLVTTTLSSTTV